MKACHAVLVVLLALIIVSCSGGSEYLPCSTLIVRSEENRVVLELKLENETDWDKVSKCVWLVDGKEHAVGDRSTSLSIDRDRSHSFECKLYVGKNLWCSLYGEYPAFNTDENFVIKEISSSPK